MNNKSNHSIIEISDNGLLPISDFIREDNLKYYLDKGHGVKKFEEPILIYVHSKKINWEILALSTRYGESVCLYSDKYIDNDHTQSLFDKYTSLYKVKLSDYSIFLEEELDKIDPFGDNESGENHPYFENLLDFLNLFFDSYPEIKKIVGADFKKYDFNNTIYLVAQKPGIKFAYSIHDDYILDTYGMREWVDNMPTTNISNLDDYTIIAL